MPLRAHIQHDQGGRQRRGQGGREAKRERYRRRRPGNRSWKHSNRSLSSVVSEVVIKADGVEVNGVDVTNQGAAS
jgi:hypothetical protein